MTREQTVTFNLVYDPAKDSPVAHYETLGFTVCMGFVLLVGPLLWVPRLVVSGGFDCADVGGTIAMVVVEAVLDVFVALSLVELRKGTFVPKLWLILNVALCIYWNTVFGVSIGQNWLLESIEAGVMMGVVNVMVLYTVWRTFPIRVHMAGITFHLKPYEAVVKASMGGQSAPLLGQGYSDEDTEGAGRTSEDTLAGADANVKIVGPDAV